MNISILVTFFLTFFGGPLIGGVSSARYVPVGKNDPRVTWIISIESSSSGIYEHRIDNMYLVPTSAATAEELSANRGFASFGEIDKPSKKWWMLSYDITARERTLELEIYCAFTSESKEIERVLNIEIPLFEKSTGEKAGIKYKIDWKSVEPKER